MAFAIGNRFDQVLLKSGRRRGFEDFLVRSDELLVSRRVTYPQAVLGAAPVKPLGRFTKPRREECIIGDQQR